MAVPGFVREFLSKVLGERVANVGFVDAFRGTVISAKVDGKRIRYEVLCDDGKTRHPYADEVAHLGQDGISLSA